MRHDNEVRRHHDVPGYSNMKIDVCLASFVDFSFYGYTREVTFYAILNKEYYVFCD